MHKTVFRVNFSALLGMTAQMSEEKGVRLTVSLSVRPSVCLSNAWIVTKWKKYLSRFLYHMKLRLAIRRA